MLCFSQLYGKDYYQPEHYLSKRMLERMAFPSLKEELPRLHANHSNMLPEEAETEYLKVGEGSTHTHLYTHAPTTPIHITHTQIHRYTAHTDSHIDKVFYSVNK